MIGFSRAECRLAASLDVSSFSPDAAEWPWESPDCDELLHAADPHQRRKLTLGDGSGSAFMW